MPRIVQLSRTTQEEESFSFFCLFFTAPKTKETLHTEKTQGNTSYNIEVNDLKKRDKQHSASSRKNRRNLQQ